MFNWLSFNQVENAKVLNVLFSSHYPPVNALTNAFRNYIPALKKTQTQSYFYICFLGILLGAKAIYKYILLYENSCNCNKIIHTKNNKVK